MCIFRALLAPASPLFLASGSCMSPDVDVAGCVDPLLQVHELKKLAHELFEIRDSHVKEIQQLKEDAKTGAPTQMVPGGDVAAAREQTTVLQVLTRASYLFSSESASGYLAFCAVLKFELSW